MIKIILILLLFFFRTNSAEVKIVNQNNELKAIENLIICDIKQFINECSYIELLSKPNNLLDSLCKKIWQDLEKNSLYKALTQNKNEKEKIDFDSDLKKFIKWQGQFYLKRTNIVK